MNKSTIKANSGALSADISTFEGAGQIIKIEDIWLSRGILRSGQRKSMARDTGQPEQFLVQQTVESVRGVLEQFILNRFPVCSALDDLGKGGIGYILEAVLTA